VPRKATNHVHSNDVLVPRLVVINGALLQEDIGNLVVNVLLWITFRECVLFIGTQFSNLYTAVDTPTEAT
jgi:membrane protein required for beta-lactamase induction